MSEINKPVRPAASLEGQRIARNNLRNTTSPRAREPVNRSYGLIRGKFPSRKMGRMIHWESQLERDAVMLFEFSPGVVAYREQPQTIYYAFDGKTRRYTPDFELTFRSLEIEYVEVKPAEKLLNIDEQYKFSQIALHYSRNDQVFWILQDHQIRQKDLLANLGLLMKYRRGPISLFERRQFIEKLSGVNTLSFKRAAALFGSPSCVWHLIDEQILRCNLRHRVNEETLFEITLKEDFNDELFF